MQTYELRCSQRFGLSIEETFDFFKDPANLSRITPSWLNFVIRTPDVVMRKGAEIEYVIRWMGLPLQWQTIITEYEPPFFFVDLQAKGPYKLWEHRHEFRPTEDGTVVSDTVRYALPFGPVGRMAHTAFVRRQLNEIFQYRQETLARLLGSGATMAAAPEIHPSAA